MQHQKHNVIEDAMRDGEKFWHPRQLWDRRRPIGIATVFLLSIGSIWGSVATQAKTAYDKIFTNEDRIGKLEIALPRMEQKIDDEMRYFNIRPTPYVPPEKRSP